MGDLKKILIQTMQGYTGKGLNGYSYLTVSQDGRLYTVTTIVTGPDKRYAFSDLIVRLQADLIIIEDDRNDKTLLEALLQAGVPRSQIILAYAGEPIPEPTSLT